ncbi:DnaD domain-containing protein [Bacillaceae bacterium S4-13-58]
MKNMNELEKMVQDQMTLPKKLLLSYTSLGLNETELILFLQLHRFQTEGNMFPTPSELAGCLNIGDQEASQLLRNLIQKGYLKIIQDRNEKQIEEKYSLLPLWEKLYGQKEEDKIQPKQDEGEHNLFILFEQEFGRTLSPFEIEMINVWLDQEEYEPVLIKAALREAVLLGKMNLKYIDRILFEWKRKGIRTVKDARQQSHAFHQKSNQKTITSDEPVKRDVSFYYNWLEKDGE